MLPGAFQWGAGCMICTYMDMCRLCAQHDGPQSLPEVAALVQTALVRQAPMLAEYFGISISEDGALQTLPQLIEVREV